MKQIAFIFCVLCIFSGCSVSKQTFSDAGSWIPVNFNPGKNILVIETYPISEKSNNAMEEFLGKNYTGRYEIVDRKVIMNKTGKFADTKLYPFAFLWKEKITNRTAVGSAFTYRNVDPMGNFYDRSIDKEYPTTKNNNVYGQKSYVPFFNSIIKHFGK